MSRTPDNSASVLVSTDSLRKGGNITGEIWLEVADFKFPDGHWSDFPTIILGWWLDALFRLWSEGEGRGECFFMDGSYSFEVSKESGDFILRCYSDTHSKKVCEWAGAVNLTELLRQVSDAASTVVKECHRRGWVTVDTEALESKWVYVDGVLNPQSA